MTYDRQSTYLTWGGTIGEAGDETWQCGVHLALNPSLDGPGLPTVAELESLMTDTLDDFHVDPVNRIGSFVKLAFVKAASLDPDGHYTANPVIYELDTIVSGPADPCRGGPQLAACVTLWSGQTLGKANYGRFYYPGWEAQIQAGSGRVVANDQANFANSAIQLVTDINTWAASALSSTARVRIMSKLGGGTTKRAAIVRVGDVKDTQQRRRRQIDEIYLAGPVPA